MLCGWQHCVNLHFSAEPVVRSIFRVLICHPYLCVFEEVWRGPEPWWTPELAPGSQRLLPPPLFLESAHCFLSSELLEGRSLRECGGTQTIWARD